MAVRVTLASLRRAHNDVATEVVVVDNASDDLNRGTIASAVAAHRQAGQPWAHVQLEKNLGFAGGNNVGIRRVLQTPTISHVCLLNSDVIVTDHWLDRLLEGGCRLTSAVTNKADSEQCVPVDYTLDLADCLDADREELRAGVYDRVQAFADTWYAAWRGHLVEAEPTFFCALLPVDVFQRIGLLDERFFPGGYEDDDFCLRMKQAGERTHLSRDVFIHHWGSASFGQLPHEYFSTHAKRNREYLEAKHAMRWRPRPEKPFVAYGADAAFALRREPDAARSAFLDLYAKHLTPLVEHFAREFRTIAHELSHSGLDVPPPLAEHIERVRGAGDLVERWTACVTVVDRARLATSQREPLGEASVAALHDMADRVHDLVVCNVAMHELLSPARSQAAVTENGSPVAAPDGRPSTRSVDRLRRGLRQAWHGFTWWVGFRGIVFFGGYPYPERQSDGYFQRIQQVDRLFADQWRVYVESDELRGRGRWFDRPEHRVIVLRILGSRRRRRVARLFAVAAALRCGRVYYHSVLRMHDNGLGRLMRAPWLKKVFDVHGVVPEEFRFHHDYYSAVLYEAEEATAVRTCGLVVVVTGAMHQYLQQKYRSALRGRVVAFPIFPGIQPTTAARPYVDGKPVVVYAGGLHKWQQVPKMIDAIVDSEAIGDFRELGMHVVTLPDFLAGRWPDEATRQQFAVANLAVFERLRDVRRDGAPAIHAYLFAPARRPWRQRLRAAAARTLPAHTAAGRLARQAWFAMRPPRAPAPAPPAGTLSSAATAPSAGSGERAAPCDVLVQVENFEAGGLETAALDLSAALIERGATFTLQVLGLVGPAVERARAMGVPVRIGLDAPGDYRAVVERLTPQVVLTHYSIHGAEAYRQAGVPFVQVLHNIYMWFDEAQLAEFKAAAHLTSLFIAVSEDVRRYSVARLGVPESRCVVIPGGVDMTTLAPEVAACHRAELRKALGIGPDDFVFLGVGAINHQKNHLGAVRAFAAVASSCPGARLVLLGPAFERALLEEVQAYVRHESRTWQGDARSPATSRPRPGRPGSGTRCSTGPSRADAWPATPGTG
jgi:GT2 family glycosyltransferase/glycosyltransferase involved in cell wall biosynthesis